MGWSIHCVKNTVRIDMEIAEDLLAIADKANRDGLWFSTGDIITSPSGGKLYFNPDDMEGMDYVCYKEVQDVLMKHKVMGDICFISEEGDNAGRKWGYRFYCDGTMIKLKAVVLWEPA